ncbi:MAG: class I cytochrome c [Aquabacterium sp.]|nr:class I cytochrome c [Aquabacterium sp.]
MRVSLSLAAATIALALGSNAFAGPGEDLAAAQKCSKCHTATTTKKGPSWASVADKYKGKADASDKLFTYLKTGGKMSDGDDHKKVEAADADIKALVAVVLASK